MGKKNSSNLNWPGLSASRSLHYVDSADKSVKHTPTLGKNLKLLIF